MSCVPSALPTSCARAPRSDHPLSKPGTRLRPGADTDVTSILQTRKLRPERFCCWPSITVPWPGELGWGLRPLSWQPLHHTVSPRVLGWPQSLDWESLLDLQGHLGFTWPLGHGAQSPARGWGGEQGWGPHWPRRHRGGKGPAKSCSRAAELGGWAGPGRALTGAERVQLTLSAKEQVPGESPGVGLLRGAGRRAQGEAAAQEGFFLHGVGAGGLLQARKQSMGSLPPQDQG